MIPAAFDYRKPACIDEAIACLAQHGSDARVIAGGQSLLLLLKARSIEPKILVDISALEQLSGIQLNGNAVSIGALTTQAALADSRELRQLCPLFARVASVVGDPVVCNRGTFVGALAFADPASDWAALALALDARLSVKRLNATLTMSIAEFFRDSFVTALQSSVF